MAFKKGDIVKVKQGVIDPDFGDDIGGWQGEITDVADSDVCIDLDSISISECPDEYIRKCEEDGLDWEKIYLSVEDVEPAISRDTTADLHRTREEIRIKHQWDHLGESSKRMYEVLKDINTTDEDAVMDAWEQYLSKKLSFPFDAEISEYLNNVPVQQGDKIRAHGIIGSDVLSGILIQLRSGEKVFQFPLCDTEVLDEKSYNCEIVHDYKVWFDNRW